MYLDYCGIGQAGAVKLAQLVSIPASAVETLSLQGNVLRDTGLLDLSLGLARSQRLATLNIADNGIRHVRHHDATSLSLSCSLRCWLD